MSAALIACPVAGSAEPVAPARWDVTSTVVDLTVPGAPGFLLKMAKGKSRKERKCLAAGQGIAALLVPDPKAQCRIDKQEAADGRYSQVLICPQKRGEPMRIVRSGTYDDRGFVGRAEMTGRTAKGAMRILLDQRAARVGGTCRIPG